MNLSSSFPPLNMLLLAVDLRNCTLSNAPLETGYSDRYQVVESPSRLDHFDRRKCEYTACITNVLRSEISN